MRPKQKEPASQHDLFRERLENILNRRHEFYRLAGLINWEIFEQEFGALYSEAGRPGTPIRLLVGLTYLQHAFDLSDEQVVTRWVENPYWQYFCGKTFFQHELPIDSSSLTRWRKRISESGSEMILRETVQVGLKTKTVKEQSLKRITVDTTVQPKAVAFPTDARLYNRARERLVKLAEDNGINLRQSYKRLGPRALKKAGRYAHARQMKRAKREIKRLKTFLGRVYRDVERKIESQSVWRETFEPLLSRAARLLAQKRTDKQKLYSIHAPEVECIAKGKAHKKYEFGVKVSVAVTNRDNFVVGMQALAGSPFDGHTLGKAIGQVTRITGTAPERCYVDKGYRGHRLKEPEVFLAGQRKGVTPTIKRELKRRNAVEPVIGHMKEDGKLGRNFLKGYLGDKINALLCGAGHNIRLVLRKLRALLYFLLHFPAWRTYRLAPEAICCPSYSQQ